MNARRQHLNVTETLGQKYGEVTAFFPVDPENPVQALTRDRHLPDYEDSALRGVALMNRSG